MFTLALPNLLQLKRSVAMNSSNDLWSGMHGCIGPFFPETKSRRFENTVEATRVTVHYKSLSFGTLNL
jgi:hypothetical protein